jgi:membrane protein YdbS with pleckstrin-like domain
MSNIDPAPTPNPVPSNQTHAPHAEPGDQEEIYFEGSPPIRSESGKVVLFSLLCIALLVASGWMIVKHVGPWWLSLILIAIAITVAFIPKLLAVTVRYRISNYRIDFERGLIARNIDTLELWHVEDLHFHQSILDRIFDVGTITVVSHDETLPSLSLRGLPNPRPLYETLKQRVIAVKRQRGVIKMDPG